MSIREKLHTVDDVWHLTHLAENEGKRFSLLEGALIEMSPPGGVHGIIAVRSSTKVGDFVDLHQLGFVTVETGYHPPDDPKTLLVAPDVAFISHARAPVPFPDGYVPVMPDLAIEIVSPNVRLDVVCRKAVVYLNNGTRLVWIMQPLERVVDVCRGVTGTRLDIEFVGMDGVLDGEDVLPGFKVKVSELFPSKSY